MNSTCSHRQDDWELYALGGLPEEVQASMTAHLESGCRECQERYVEAQMALTAMSHLAPRHRPSPNVERKLMRAIQAEPARAARAWPFWRFAPWAAAFACLLLTLWLAQDRSRLQTEMAESQKNVLAERQKQQAQQDELQARLRAEELARNSVDRENLEPNHNNEAKAQSNRSADPASRTTEDGRLRLQLDRAQQEAKLAEADKAALQQRVDQLQADLLAATNRAGALEKDLRAEREQQQVNPDKNKDRLSQSASDQTAILAAELAKSQAEVRRLAAAAKNAEQIDNLLQSASLQQISLRSVIPQAGHATARALYSPQGGLLLLADSLPPLPAQKCYQLWLIRKGSPSILSGGLITLQEDGKGILFAPPSKDLSELTALAITDEPAGGSVAARGKKLLFGAQ